jgi:hypothetical protein
MSTECDGLLEGRDKNFAIRTGPQMPAYLPANVGWKFVVDIGRQLPEKIQAPAFAMRMMVRYGPGTFLWRHRLFLVHERKPPDL